MALEDEARANMITDMRAAVWDKNPGKLVKKLRRTD